MATGMDRLVCVSDFEREAQLKLPLAALDYYRAGAGDEYTLHRNKEAYRRRICTDIRGLMLHVGYMAYSVDVGNKKGIGYPAHCTLILPRFLRDVSHRSLKCRAMGRDVAMPISVAPAAMQKMAHPEGECANARAAGRAGVIYTLSSLSTTSLEDVAAAAPDTTLWFQLYIYRDRSVTEQLVKRAYKAGYKSIVLTVDAPIFGIRRADVRNRFSLPPHLRLENFAGVARSEVTAKGGSGIMEYVNSLFDPTLTWSDLAWLKKLSPLPLVVKGVMTPQDALLAAQYGASAVLVSNHGARQLDTVPATIEVLPAIASALRGRSCEIYIDGGVTTGTDVFKALALGAKMVFVGRPALWGLAVAGEAGVSRVLDILRQELDNAMALAGCTRVEDITPEYVRTAPNSKL